MKIINIKDVAEKPWSSPKGKFGGAGQDLSEALGRDPQSTDLMTRHPFDVEIQRIPPGKINYPYHAHSAQWEWYHVLTGRGQVRHGEGTTPIAPGDAFIFKPGEPHQLINDGTEDLILYVIADNPLSGATWYPDSLKWAVRIPDRRVIRSGALEYYDGEE